MIPQIGDRVKITGVMPNDPAPLPIGLMGTVEEVVFQFQQIHVEWDEDEEGRRRSLILLFSDPFVVVP